MYECLGLCPKYACHFTLKVKGIKPIQGYSESLSPDHLMDSIRRDLNQVLFPGQVTVRL